ncbi:MAG: phosphoenolpyruvate carboxylase, partial [Gemmatimonadaceae bacterium]
MTVLAAPKFRSVVLDVDSTLCSIEGIDWLAGLRGEHVSALVEAETSSAMRGEVALESVYGNRLSLVSPTLTEVESLAERYVATLAPGAAAAIRDWQLAGVRVALVSGGIRNAILPLAIELNIEPGMVNAVDVYFDTDGDYDDFDRTSPLATATGKRDVVERLGLPSPCLVAGDGFTDLAMRDAADAFAAFTGTVSRPGVVEHADFIANSFAALTDIILGGDASKLTAREAETLPATDPDTRPQDVPLHEDVRLLGDALGKVIARLEGDAAFEVVDALRRDCKARRRNAPDAPELETLITRAGELSNDLAGIAARAFTLFFLLINTAEQVHRVRRRRSYQSESDVSPQPASARWTMKLLRERGFTAPIIAEALARLEIRPVLTAHPTESTRRTLLSLQSRVADLLLAREARPRHEQLDIEELLGSEVELLWLTSEVRRDRPTVGDEVSTVLWYLETRLLQASAHAMDSMTRAFETEFQLDGDDSSHVPTIRIGTWVGGDRDGNPFVTPATTIAAARRASHIIVGKYQDAVDELVRQVSVSTRIADITDALQSSLEPDRELMPAVWEANSRRNADEPIRLKLTFIAARLAATRALIAARDAG